MIEINTSNLKSRKKVEIDGHPYIVRRYGAGEQLTLNQLFREAKKIEKKLEDGTATEEDDNRTLELSEKMVNILVGLFDDGIGGTKSRQLVGSLNQEEIAELFTQIFDGESDATEVS